MSEENVAKTKTWVRVLLIGSLCLNVGFVGLIVGVGWKMHMDGPSEMMRAPSAPASSMYLRALDDDGRRQIGERLREKGRKDRRLPVEIRQGFETALELLRAETFDANAFDAVMEKHASHSDQRLAQARLMFLEHLATLSYDDRVAYADRLEKNLTRGPRKRHN